LTDFLSGAGEPLIPLKRAFIELIIQSFATNQSEVLMMVEDAAIFHFVSEVSENRRRRRYPATRFVFLLSFTHKPDADLLMDPPFPMDACSISELLPQELLDFLAALSGRDVSSS
jgi:hypothetical protein